MKILKSTAILAVLLAVLLCFVACDDPAENGAIYTFSHNGCDVAVDADMASLITSLGAPLHSDALGTCGLRGEMDRIFDYSDFTIYTAEVNGKDRIDSLVLKSDLVSTKEGIAIGDDEAKVVEKYGEPTVRKQDALEYDGVHMKLDFYLENGVVTSIEYRYTIEE